MAVQSAFQIIFRQSVRRSMAASHTGQQFGRRAYATEQGSASKGGSDYKWLIASAGLGLPAIYYLSSSGPIKKPHSETEKARHEGLDYAELSSAPKAAAGGQGPVPKEQNQGLSRTDARPSDIDPPSSRKGAQGPTSMSAKQEGLSNTETSNPFVNEPGKSVKGEGETETVKVKGTVSTQRPQA